MKLYICAYSESSRNIDYVPTTIRASDDRYKSKNRMNNEKLADIASSDVHGKKVALRIYVKRVPRRIIF